MALLLIAVCIGAFLSDSNRAGLFCVFLLFSLKLWEGLRLGVISIFLGRPTWTWTVYRSQSPERFTFGIIFECLWVVGSLIVFLVSL